MPEEVANELKEIQDFRDLLSEIITDLTVARDTMDDTLDQFKDPIKLLLNGAGELQKRIEHNSAKVWLYLAFATNKFEALGSIHDKGGEKE